MPLTGPLPSSIGNLTNLTLLSIISTQLTGTLPSELGSLSNLVFASFQQNDFTGSIPQSLSRWKNAGTFGCDRFERAQFGVT